MLTPQAEALSIEPPMQDASLLKTAGVSYPTQESTQKDLKDRNTAGQPAEAGPLALATHASVSRRLHDTGAGGGRRGGTSSSEGVWAAHAVVSTSDSEPGKRQKLRLVILGLR